MSEKKPRVAIIDDERHVRELLEMSLQKHGFATKSAPDGQSGLHLVREWRPDAVVLDVMMPKLDGLEVLPMLRRITECPVLMLSAKGDVADRVRGIELGADDYLPKPFDIVEVVARLRAALRRPHLDEREILTYGDLAVDLQRCEVTRGEREIKLTAREYALLGVLLRHPGRVFSRDHLLDRVWARADVSIASVETYVCYLRAKIDGAGEPPLIHTIRGAGYSLRGA